MHGSAGSHGKTWWSTKAYLRKDMGRGPCELREAASGAKEVVPDQDNSLACRASGGCGSKGRVSQRGGLQGTIGHQGGQRQLSPSGQALYRERAVSTGARLLQRHSRSAHWCTGVRQGKRSRGKSIQVHTHG